MTGVASSPLGINKFGRRRPFAAVARATALHRTRQVMRPHEDTHGPPPIFDAPANESRQAGVFTLAHALMAVGHRCGGACPELTTEPTAGVWFVDSRSRVLLVGRALLSSSIFATAPGPCRGCAGNCTT